MSIRSLTINQLIALQTLVTTENVSLAARQCAISQAGMSLTLKKLRSVFNDELIEKSGNGYQRTQFALQLLPKISEILNQVHNLSDFNHEFDASSYRRQFVISIPGFYEHLLLAPLLSHTSKKNPYITFEIKQRGLNPALDELYSKKSDLAVLLCPDKKLLPDDIYANHLRKERIYFCVHGSMAEKNSSSESLYFKGKHVILRNHITGNRGILDESLQAVGKSRDIIGIASSMYVALMAQQSNPELIISAPEIILKSMQKFFAIKIYPVPIDVGIWNLYSASLSQFKEDPALNWLHQTLFTSVNLPINYFD